jgi:hypothetical protein
MKILDIVMACIPLIVFIIHLVFGRKMKIFQYEDGMDNLGLLIIVGVVYVTGLMVITTSRPVAYYLLIASFLIRPIIFLSCQYWAKSYRKKHNHPYPKRRSM